jgi:disulfide bond formation protein DsbB
MPVAVVAGLDRPRRLAWAIFLAAAATVGGALAFQYGFGYIPCKLCLEQRIPYYVAMPLALVMVAVPLQGRMRRLAAIGLALLALVFAVSTGLGAYHAGVEWGFWPGPADCAGSSGAAPAMGEFLNQLNSIKVVSCTDAAWRFLGLSLAGWNALISAGLASLAVSGAWQAWQRSAV